MSAIVPMVIATFGLFAVFASMLASVASATDPPKVWTDKENYYPEEVVLINGTGFLTDHAVNMTVTRPDGAQDNWTADSNGTGSFNTTYDLDGIFGLYLLEAFDGTNYANTTFWDAEIDFAQCRNDSNNDNIKDDCDWTGGALNAVNSVYVEGNAVPQRLFHEIDDPGTHTMRLQYDFTKADKYAYDFLTTVDLTQSGSLLQECANLPTFVTSSECSSVFSGAINAAIPSDSFDGVSLREYPASRYIKIGGVTSPSMTIVGHDPSGTCFQNCGNSGVSIDITFTTSGANQLVGLWFAGHLAIGIDPPGSAIGWGDGYGASSISGLNFHISYLKLDGKSVGNRDNQVNTGTVLPPGEIKIVKKSLGGNDTFPFTATGTDVSPSFDIVTSGGGVGTEGTGSKSFTALDTGTYTFTESTPPTGWDFIIVECTKEKTSSITYDQPNRKVTIDLVAADVVTCTFKNEKDAVIIVEKQTDPDGDTTEFEFDPSWAANFFLSDGETETSGDLDPGTYDVSEIVPAGWDLDSVVCTSSNGDSETNTAISLQAISLQAGETVTCTFTNEKRGTVIVEKYTTGGDGSFTFELLGVGTLTFSTGAGYGTGTFSNVVPGTYSVTEQVPPGWTLFSATCSAGTPASFTVAPGQTVTCTFKNIRSGLVTTSALCTFDRNPNQAGQQFRLILTQDPTAQSTYKVTATNPGQFFFNIFVEGSGSLTVTATLPYPFVTKGAVPIHVYDSVSVTTVDGKSCLVPGTLIATSSQSVSLGSYSGTFGITVDVPISFTSSGFAYIAIHMDYGLKGTVGWTKGTSNEAIGSGAYSGVTILDLATYTFSFAVTAGSSTTSPGSATIQNENTFKHDPGFAGLVLTASDGTPVEGVTVKIYKPNGQPLATLTTDVDGFYFYNYKHTGKPATFKIVCSGQPVYVLVKANAFVWVNFYI